MDAELFKELFPLQYMKKFIEKSIRPDGRQFKQARQINIEFIDGMINYTYSDCFISLKYLIQEIEMKEIDLNQCLKFSLNIDSIDEIINQDRIRLEKLYISSILDVIPKIINGEQLKSQNNKAYSIDFQIRVLSNDGSLITHLLNLIYFSLTQIKINTQPLILRNIKVQSYGIIDNNILIDPTMFEEQCCSIINIIIFQDNGEYIIKKYDGKSINFIQLQEVLNQ